MNRKERIVHQMIMKHRQQNEHDHEERALAFQRQGVQM